MQLLWHSLVNASFGYLMLIALVRIAQEIRSCLPMKWQRPKGLLQKQAEDGLVR